MNLLKICAYCQTPLYMHRYGCPCNPDLSVCISCSKIDCHQCKGKMQLMKMGSCSSCFSTCLESQMLEGKIGRGKFCWKCCYDAYRVGKFGVVQIGRTREKVDKERVQRFLKLFCFKCSKKLPESEGIQMNDSSPRKQKKVEQTFCKKCSKSQSPQKIPSSPQMPQSPLSPIPNPKQPKQPSPQKQKQKPEQKTRWQLFDMWCKKQNQAKSTSTYPYSYSSKASYYDTVKCMSCDLKVFKHQEDSVITQDMVICKFCANRSKIQEKEIEKYNQELNSMKNSSMKEKQKEMGSQRPDIEYTEPKNKPQLKQISKSIHSQQNSQQKIQQKFQKQIDCQKKPTRHKNEPVLKKSDSEDRLQNFKLDLQLTNDSEMIQCSSCRIQIQARYSIWEDEKDVVYCKCCYADFIEELLKQEERQSKAKKYVPKETSEKVQKKFAEQIRPSSMRKERDIDQKTGYPKPMNIDYLDGSQSRYSKTTISKKETNIMEQTKKMQPQKRYSSSSKPVDNPKNQFSGKNVMDFNDPITLPKTNKLQNLMQSPKLTQSPVIKTNQRPLGLRKTFANPRYNYSENIDKPYQSKKCAMCEKSTLISGRYKINEKVVCLQCIQQYNLRKNQMKS